MLVIFAYIGSFGIYITTRPISCQRFKQESVKFHLQPQGPLRMHSAHLALRDIASECSVNDPHPRVIRQGGTYFREVGFAAQHKS